MIGFGVGAGLLLVLQALTDTRPRPLTAGRVGLRGRWAARLARAGLHGAPPLALPSACLVSAVVAGLLVQALSGTFPVAAVFAVIAGYLPLAVLQGRARRRERELAEVWPEAVDHLASAVRAGLSLPEALTQLGHRGPEPLRPHFRAFGVDYQVTGRFAESLDRLKDRLADPVGDRVVEGLRVAREVGGGDLGRLLRNLSGYLRQDARTRSELEARQAWAVNGARLAVSAPWLVLLALSFQREVIGRYATPSGVVVLASGALCCLLAYRLMLRIGRLPRERRVLG